MKQVGRDVCVCVCVLGTVRKQWRVRRDSRKRQVRKEQGQGSAGHTGRGRVSQGTRPVRQGRSSRAELGVRGKPGGSAVLGLAYILGADC